VREVESWCRFIKKNFTVSERLGIWNTFFRPWSYARAPYLLKIRLLSSAAVIITNKKKENVFIYWSFTQRFLFRSILKYVISNTGVIQYEMKK
jgi:hypothetical protein